MKKIKKKAMRRKICVLCRKPFSEFGCSPFPLRRRGLCCNRCDDMKVTPARLIFKGVPAAEAHVIGANIWRAVQWHRKKKEGVIP